MRLKSEAEILDLRVRKQIIDEINGPENRRRKDYHYKVDQCLEDQTKVFVIEMLLKMFKSSTVERMSYAISNISILKKIINKLARVYSNGVDRQIADSDIENEILNKVVDLLKVNQQMKLANITLKAHKNCPVFVKPCRQVDPNGETCWDVRIDPLSPHLYDAVENFWDRTTPMCFILSNYDQQATRSVSIDPAAQGRTVNQPLPPKQGDGRDQKIADKKEDQDQGDDSEKLKPYIWWANSYHFTTNGLGQIVDENMVIMVNQGQVPDDELISNPIGEMPFENLAIGQRNSFFARGGDDLVDGSVLVNSMITNVNHVGITQGYGQLVMKGKNLPRIIEGGPDSAILLEYEKEDHPVPEFDFVSANPSADNKQPFNIRRFHATVRFGQFRKRHCTDN
jgi:hypothetical protein